MRGVDTDLARRVIRTMMVSHDDRALDLAMRTADELDKRRGQLLAIKAVCQDAKDGWCADDVDLADVILDMLEG